MTYNTINDAVTMAGDGDSPAGNGGADRSMGDSPTMKPKEGRGGRGAFVPGDIIARRYVVEQTLGEGGMGIVYQCLDRVGGVKVAVKCLPPEVSRNAEEMEDIRANYRLVSDLHHPNIAGARTLELDESTGDCYLVMDLAPGMSLKRWMKRNPQATMEAKLAILRQVAAALDYAHAKKIIHRDVKPENVMVDDDGGVKVLDFGLAAQIRSSQSRTSAAVTSRGGTPGYKSPEQWRGKAQREPSDVYSFGVMTYWMFAGVLPFDGDDLLVLGHAVLTEPVEPVAGIPAHMNAALVKALAKTPEERFASCGAFMDALEGKDFNRAEHVERVGGGNGRAGAPRPPQGGSRLIAAVKGLLAVVALAVGVVGGWWWVNHTPSLHTPPPLRGTSPNLGEELRGSSPETGEVAAGQRGMTPTTNSPSKIEGVAEGRGSMTDTEEATRKADEMVRQNAADEEAERIAKASATEIRNEALTQQRAVSNISGEDGFWVKKDDLYKDFARAEELFKDEKVKNWSEAAMLFTNYVTECKALLALDGERLSAKAARTKAGEAKVGAEKAEADKYVLTSWSEAVSQFNNAAREFASGQFANANSSFLSVASQFYKCTEEANAERTRQAKEKEAQENAAREAAAAKAQAEKGARERKEAEEKTNMAYGNKPQHGDTKTLTLPGGATMEMIYVGPGEFTMGSPTSEDWRDDDEVQHRVTLTKGYWLGKYEVTQRQWRSVMGDNPSEFKGDDRPVENVSWEDCQRFMSKVDAAARRQLGCGARLPTEAEWEYACRAGSTGPYGGNGNLDDMGWYYGNSGRETHEVGQKRQNAWGFHDMNGNVWEWCDDWYASYPVGSVTDPTGPVSGTYRVLRGGSWSYNARYCRSAYRDRCHPGVRSRYGFRLCCSAGPRE